MSDMNRGYEGYSMSKRASSAYLLGAKPLSKWGRADLDEFLAFAAGHGIEFDIRTVKEFREALRRGGLVSWHHTSKYANRTEFYHPLGWAGLDEDGIGDLDGGALSDEQIEELRYTAQRIRKRREFQARLKRGEL